MARVYPSSFDGSWLVIVDEIEQPFFSRSVTRGGETAANRILKYALTIMTYSMYSNKDACDVPCRLLLTIDAVEDNDGPFFFCIQLIKCGLVFFSLLLFLIVIDEKRINIVPNQL
jgi:hypothetical protein